MPRRELKGDPSNPSTRRRASGSDPRKGPRKEPTGAPDPFLRANYAGLRVPCPVCTGVIWSHQLSDQLQGYRTPGTPGHYLDPDRILTPMVVRRFPKNPHTGAHGTFFEYSVATLEEVEWVARWIARQMDAWLSRHAPPDARGTRRDVEDLQSALENKSTEAEALRIELEQLREDYVRLKYESERLGGGAPARRVRRRPEIPDHGNSAAHLLQRGSLDFWIDELAGVTENSLKSYRVRCLNNLKEQLVRCIHPECAQSCCEDREALEDMLARLS